MLSEWQDVSLAEITRLRNGAAVKQVYFADTGVPLARVSDFTLNSIDLSGCNYIDETHAESWANYLLAEGDIVVATVGSWPPNWSSVVGKVVRTPRLAAGAIQNQNTCSIIPDSDAVDNTYLYYRLKCEDFAWHAANNAGGSANQARLPVKKIGEFRIMLPPIREQQSIAVCLKSLDDKIELNRQMNETLEAMAQALFKSWFVDFEPVIDNALAAGNEIPEPLQKRAAARQALGDQRKPLPAEIQSLFPDRFVFTDEMGWVPEGWGVIPLDKLANFQNGLALQKFRPEEGADFLPVVKIAQLKKGFADGGERASIDIKPECIIDDGDVIFSWSGSLMVDIWCGGRAALNQHLFKVTSSTHPKWFYHQYTEQHLMEFQRIAADKAVTMGHIKREHLSSAFCALPPSDLIDTAGKFFNSYLERRIINRTENRNLSLVRDTLLPKLLSGELRISDAEKQVAEAV